MKIALVTDAWRPQVNGVVTTLSTTQAQLEGIGHTVQVVSPLDFRTIPCPTYPEIRLALFPNRGVAQALGTFQPDAIHVATEGPLGIAARKYCVRHDLKFTTSYHTQFPQYVRKRVPIPIDWSYAYLRNHHSRANRTLVATEHMRRELVERGFKNLVIWSRGVDTQLFKPDAKADLAGERPISMYVGRVAVEKNLDAYLSAGIPGTKYVVGGGPDLEVLTQRYPAARFVGYKFGAELAQYLAAADVFVFPSRTDTFGLVMLEAMACGTPVAAYPVTGPIDVVRQGFSGALDEDLSIAVEGALRLDRQNCRAAALERTWEKATSQFLSHLVQAKSGQDLELDAAELRTQSS
jgi:glycosyltransferase involved in cell wall biosynthesis